MKLIKRSLVIEIAKKAGYSLRKSGDYYTLHAPDGTRITPERKSTHGTEYAYDYLPQSVIERDGFAEDFTTTKSDEVAIVDEGDTEAIRTISRRFGPCGTDWIVLTPADLVALQSGKCIVWGQSEYSSVIFFTEELPE